MARNTVNVGDLRTNKQLADRFEKMLNNVANMLDNNGPIYTTWIYFRIGTDESKSIKFDTTSTNMQENLIASLSVEKSCSGVANTFTLTVQYDPFNFGQNTKDTVEKLDEFIAAAMSEDFENPSTSCRGYIQYGYNSTSAKTDDELVSPLYSFFMTNATSSVSFDSGISTYTFTGTSTLSADCDYVTDFKKIEDQNLLETVGKILYEYYGDSSNPPTTFDVSGIEPTSATVKYAIDISSTDIADAPKISMDASSATQSPWSYCKQLLDDNPLTQSEIDSGKYDDMSNISLNKRPKYTLYLTDEDNHYTIHVAHFAPGSTTTGGKETVTDTSAISINYVFSWGMKNENLQNKNIVTGWKPEVNLYTYLMRKANHERYLKIKELYEKDPNKYGKIYDQLAVSFSDDVVEMYNAELEILGIPADPPMSAEIQVIPRILESISRTAGIYAITGASDEISNTGIFRTTLKLFRLRSRDAQVVNTTNTNTQAQNNMLFSTNNHKLITPPKSMYDLITSGTKNDVELDSKSRYEIITGKKTTTSTMPSKDKYRDILGLKKNK